VLLTVENLEVGYLNKVVVCGLSLGVHEKEIVALIGHNGGGKSTTLKGIFGLLKPFGGQILYKDRNVAGRRPADNMKDGMSYTPQDRFLFPGLSVRENLALGGYIIDSRPALRARMEVVYHLFPILRARALQTAQSLSGGERRMLGMGISFMVHPQLLLLDEPSVGLAPHLVTRLMESLVGIRREYGTAMLLVEQNVKQALRIAEKVYVLKTGRITLEEKGQTLLERGELWDLF
jgi:branched-chain amino acid transport system ATP-binding protein